MTRPVLLGQTAVPGSHRVLSLYRGKHDCTITLSGAGELMSTRKNASEQALATLPCQMLSSTDAATVLIGGLGMGFTLAAALAATGTGASVTVAELVPDVIEWNRGPLGEYSGFPLRDKRTILYGGDVADLLRRDDCHYDVVALDVDNGPEALSSGGNDWLYSVEGVHQARQSLNPGGVLAYWSATADRRFAKRLRHCGLQVIEKSVYAHGSKGAMHTIWLATVKTGCRRGFGG